MEINGKITFLVDIDRTTIKIIDDDAGITFIEITLTPEQLSSALSRLAYTNCKKVEVRNLDNVGKQRENKRFEFKLPDEFQREYYSVKAKIIEYAKTIIDDWILYDSFNSQDSFFVKDGIWWGRCTIIRWVEKNKI